jgi:hypothetical protein
MQAMVVRPMQRRNIILAILAKVWPVCLAGKALRRLSRDPWYGLPMCETPTRSLEKVSRYGKVFN